MCFPAQESSLFPPKPVNMNLLLTAAAPHPHYYLSGQNEYAEVLNGAHLFPHSTLRQLPPHRPYHCSLLGSKADESKWGLMRWKEPAATWFYGLLEDIVMV